MRFPKFSFTSHTADSSFGRDFNHTLGTSVSHDPSRKSFLAKMIGLGAAVGLAPRLVARAAVTPAAADTPATKPAVVVRPDARAVARRTDSV
jgi:hypothetical protein